MKQSVSGFTPVQSRQIQDILRAHDRTEKMLAEIADLVGLPLADGAVAEPKLADGAVTENKLSDQAVTALKTMEGVDGWLGSKTRIKILPGDFITTNPDKPAHGAWQAAGVSANSTDSKSVNAYIPIPTGYRATAARVYAHADAVAKVVAIYRCDIADSTCASLNTGTPAAEITFDPVDSTDTNFLMITVEAPNNHLIYGGYVTIEMIL